MTDLENPTTEPDLGPVLAQVTIHRTGETETDYELKVHASADDSIRHEMPRILRTVANHYDQDAEPEEAQ